MSKALVHIAALSCVLMALQPAVAHEDKPHVMGTVQLVEPDHLIVKTSNGQSVSVRRNAATVYRDAEGKRVESPALHSGDRVVVDVTGKGQQMTATDIRFSHHEEHEQ